MSSVLLVGLFDLLPCPINSSIDKDSYFKVMEKKYLIPMLVAQERLEATMNSLYKNQMQIQKGLNKRQVGSQNYFSI